MTSQQITLTEEQFDEQYQPECDKHGGTKHYDWGTRKQDAFLASMQLERRLWTALEDDNGFWCLANGYHYVNRLYYVVTDKPWAEDADIFVQDAPARCACGELMESGYEQCDTCRMND